MKPYRSARDEFQHNAIVWLDANENPYETGLNRYPDPQQKKLKSAIAKLNGLDAKQIFIGNGSDEAIDLLFRAFCEPDQDKVFIFPPTYGMYEVVASINNVEVLKIPLQDGFQIPPLSEFKGQLNSKGLLFICSPNNPTGSVVSISTIQQIAQNFSGLVAVDEAYIDFSEKSSTITMLDNLPNLVVLQTLSKAWGMAGIRIGMAFANRDIIEVLNKIKPPYNVNTLSQQKALEILKSETRVNDLTATIKQERKKITNRLNALDIVSKCYPSEANFILVEFADPSKVYRHLACNGIIVRNRANDVKNCLRITVGTPKENIQLLNALEKM
jgi:histidinol-phosphate aminotransferase